MQILKEFSSLALLGTQQQPNYWPAVAGQLAPSIAALKPADTTAAPVQLLRAAGVVSICEMAGVTLPVIDMDTHPTTTIPSTPTNILTSPKILQQLTIWLDDSENENSKRLFSNELLQIALNTIAQHELVLPLEKAPQLLRVWHRHNGFRASIASVLSYQAVWLAQQNPAWKRYYQTVTGNLAANMELDESDTADSTTTEVVPEDVWQHGTLGQRKAYLLVQRKSNPANARELLVSELSKLNARERKDLLELFVENISMDDEDFLETLLAKDRSSEVRSMVAHLLRHLPESRHVIRVGDALKHCLRQTKNGTWTLEPPETFTPELKMDGIDEKLPAYHAKTLGERAYWLNQMVMVVPFTWWETNTGLTPSELLKWARKGNWYKALKEAWEESVQPREKNKVWAKAFCEDYFEVREERRKTGKTAKEDWNYFLESLAKPLSLEEQTPYLLQIIESEGQRPDISWHVRYLIEYLGRICIEQNTQLSDELSMPIIHLIFKLLEKDKGTSSRYYQVEYVLESLVDHFFKFSPASRQLLVTNNVEYENYTEILYKFKQFEEEYQKIQTWFM